MARKDTRMMHQQIIMTNMGTTALPAPLRMEAMAWEKARRQ